MGGNVGVDYMNTWTCYEGKDHACGECTACSSRIQGFLDAKLIDPLPYDREIPWQSYGAHPII